MIKPINISPIDTAKEFYFDCGNCGAKNKVYFTNRVIHVDNKNDLEDLKTEPCPFCGKPLGDPCLPKLSSNEINTLSKMLFAEKCSEFPREFYLHLLFDDASQHSELEKLSERIESLSQFITKNEKGQVESKDKETIIILIDKLLKYLLAEGYIDDTEYHVEYQRCIEIINNYFA
ncbi:MAG: hypothetical protein M1607_03315 [Patescibacteria group bacterium]|nr:hypothetical protein [Patescibacteria group bacterium]